MDSDDLAAWAEDPALRADDLAPWAACRSIHDLAECTAAWLQGEIGWTPHHVGPPGPDLAPIASALVALNRAGLLTTFAQPGLIHPRRDGGDGVVAQRAAVVGYATPWVLNRIEIAIERFSEMDAAGELDVSNQPVALMRRVWRGPRRRARIRTPVTVAGAGLTEEQIVQALRGLPAGLVPVRGHDDQIIARGLHEQSSLTWLISYAQHRHGWMGNGGIGRDAIHDLERTHRVLAWDTVWGRHRAVWNTLVAALSAQT